MNTSFHEWLFEKLLKEMSDLEAEQILGVKRGDPNLDDVWKKLAFRNHPDRGGDLQLMKQINVAHDVLADPPRDPFGGMQPNQGGVPEPERKASVSEQLQGQFMWICRNLGYERLIEILFQVLESKGKLLDYAKELSRDGPKGTKRAEKVYQSEEEAKEDLKLYYSRDIPITYLSRAIARFAASWPSSLQGYDEGMERAWSEAVQFIQKFQQSAPTA